MMGQQTRTESLFYDFRIQDQIPGDHLLRVMHDRVDLTFVRERVKDLYSTTGRPSIYPEMLLRLLVVGYLYEITTKRRADHQRHRSRLAAEVASRTSLPIKELRRM